MKIKMNKLGFTIVEIVIAVALAVALFIFVIKMTTFVRVGVATGTVDLQNLQEAREVINYLRRDFICAIPTYDKNESPEIKDEVRADPMIYVSGSYNFAHNTKPIVVSKHDVSFSKRIIDSSKNETSIFVQYTFDPATQTLIRGNGEGSNKVFKGVKDISFDLYYHPLDEKVPMLLVSMKIETKESNKTRVLPLTTTICSSVVNRDVVNIDWNSVFD